MVRSVHATRSTTRTGRADGSTYDATSTTTLWPANVRRTIQWTVLVLHLGNLGRPPSLTVVADQEVGKQDEADACVQSWHHTDLVFEPEPEHPSTYKPPVNATSTSFVLLSLPRSATNTLMWTLNKNPYIQAEGEVFALTEVAGRFSPAEGGPWTVEAREANRTGFMHDLFELESPPAKENVLARGFKAFANHLTKSELRPITRSRRVLKIVLRRQDTLSQFISILRAFETNQWHRPETSNKLEAVQNTKIVVCPEAYEQFVKAIDDWYDWLAEESRTHPESWLFISTEQLVSNPAVMSMVYDHLMVPQGRAMPEYSPYSQDGLAERVANYDAIRHLEPDTGNFW